MFGICKCSPVVGLHGKVIEKSLIIKPDSFV